MTLLQRLRTYKITYAVYNFFHRRALQQHLPLFRRYGVRKQYFSPLSSADFKGIDGEKPWLDVQDSREVLPNHAVFQSLPLRLQTPLLAWSEEGYAILPQFFDSETVDKINAEIDQLLETKKAVWQYGNKIMFAIHQSPFLNGIGNDATLHQIFEMLLGKRMRLFQSINFLHGSEQRTHSDSIHMTTFPLGNMLAAWIALEDVPATAGPLHYFPKSHRLPYILNNEYGNEGNAFRIGKKTYKEYENHIAEHIEHQGDALEKKIFTARKGDVFIWHANLLHGGEPHLDKSLTRKSMVLHYYANDAICYHEVTQRPALQR
jgi:phytanoyl-CoA hydroxylase